MAEPMPPAPPVTKATRPARLFGFGMRCSLASSSSQYSMSKASCSGRPVIGGDARRAAHHVDGVDVELGGDARRRLVLGEGQHADAAARDRSPHWDRAWRASWRACSARNRPHSRRGSPRSARRAPRRRRHAARSAGGSWCAGNGRGRRCRAAPACRSMLELTNSSTSGESAKCPTLRLVLRDAAADLRHQAPRHGAALRLRQASRPSRPLKAGLLARCAPARRRPC